MILMFALAIISQSSFFLTRRCNLVALSHYLLFASVRSSIVAAGCFMTFLLVETRDLRLASPVKCEKARWSGFFSATAFAES